METANLCFAADFQHAGQRANVQRLTGIKVEINTYRALKCIRECPFSRIIIDPKKNILFKKIKIRKQYIRKVIIFNFNKFSN